MLGSVGSQYNVVYSTLQFFFNNCALSSTASIQYKVKEFISYKQLN